MTEPYVSLHLANLGIGCAREADLQALFEWTRRERPALLVLTGNVTHGAEPGEYERAQSFLDRLAVPRLVAVPGPRDLQSEDLFSRAVHPYGPFQRAFDMDAAPRFAGDRLWLAGLSTSRWWLSRRGAVSPRQVKSTAAWLGAAPEGRLKVVALHHALVPGGGCLGGQAALARLQSAGVGLVFSSSLAAVGAISWHGGVCHAASAGLSGAEPGFQTLRAGAQGSWWLERWRVSDGHAHYLGRVRIPKLPS